MRIFILKLKIEERISLTWSFCDLFKFFFLKMRETLLNMSFSPNVLLKFSAFSIENINTQFENVTIVSV